MSTSDSVSQNERKGFTVTWLIKNFSYLIGDIIYSPVFAVKFLYIKKCRLRLIIGRDFLGCYIGEKLDNSIFYDISICKPDGKFTEVTENTYNHSGQDWQGYVEFLRLEDSQVPDAYLKNDMLTIRCRIWRDHPILCLPINCYVHTEINIEKHDYMWTINGIKFPSYGLKYKFNKAFEIPIYQSDAERVMKVVISSEKNIEEDDIRLTFCYGDGHSTVFLGFEIHLMNPEGVIVYSVRGKRMFNYNYGNTEFWDFPLISRRKIHLDEPFYASNGVLNLRCRFLFSSKDNVTYKIERYEYGNTDQPQIESATSEHIQKDNVVWIGNMQKCTTLGKFSDVTFRTPNREYPAHRAILCAHSEVFDAMFEHNMKEHNTGFVDVEDLEDDTVAKMLSFLYSGTVDDMDFPSARKLFYAADKYGIESLQNMCSNYLISVVDLSNVCDILVIADRHRDQKLMLRAREYVGANSLEIMNSENWVGVMKNHGQLAAEVMHYLFVKSGKN